MDTHSESVSESPAVEQLPDTFEANSFEAALNAAFNNLENGGGSELPDPEETEESSSEVEQQPETTEQVADEDPLEQLSEDVDWTPKAANRFKQLKE